LPRLPRVEAGERHCFANGGARGCAGTKIYLDFMVNNNYLNLNERLDLRFEVLGASRLSSSELRIGAHR